MASPHGPQYSALSGSVPFASPATQRSQCVERPAAGDQRHDAPQRSRVALELGDARREVRAEAAEARPCTAGREVADDRLDQVDHGPPHVGLGARAGCPPSDSPAASSGHAAITRSAPGPRPAPRGASGSPARKRRTSATARSPMREISLPSEPAMCGVRTTFGRSYSGESAGNGSGSGVSMNAQSRPATHSLRERVGVDERSTRGVDQPRAVVHPRQSVGVHEVTGRRQLRRVHGDDVGPTEEVVEIHARDAERSARRRRRDTDRRRQRRRRATPAARSRAGRSSTPRSRRRAARGCRRSPVGPTASTGSRPRASR